MGCNKKNRYLSQTARHLGRTRRMTQTDGTRSTTAHPAAEGRLVSSDGDDPRESASRRAAAKRDGSRRREYPKAPPGDDQAIPPVTGGDDEQTNDGGRNVAAPRYDSGNRLARGRLANPRNVANPCIRPLRYPTTDGVPAGWLTRARPERHPGPAGKGDGVRRGAHRRDGQWKRCGRHYRQALSRKVIRGSPVEMSLLATARVSALQTRAGERSSSIVKLESAYSWSAGGENGSKGRHAEGGSGRIRRNRGGAAASRIGGTIRGIRKEDEVGCCGSGTNSRIRELADTAINPKPVKGGAVAEERTPGDAVMAADP